MTSQLRSAIAGTTTAGMREARLSRPRRVEGICKSMFGSDHEIGFSSNKRATMAESR
jgi:hypothetical protein